MKKFMFVYKGEETDMSAVEPEKAKQIMDAWEAWMTQVGDALVDVGTPLSNGASVVDDGSEGTPAQLTGYSIVQAEDLAGAKALTSGHPFLSEGQGNYAIDVFEQMPVPMDS